MRGREQRRKKRGQKSRERDTQKEKEKGGGGIKRSWSGYETNSDLIWHVYDSVFFSFFQALRCRLELDWVVA